MSRQPKEPENEAGRAARQQYLEQARKVIGEPDLDYATLYQRFAGNDWAAIKLDDAVALAALSAGNTPKAVVGMLHQSPYLQYQVHENKVPLPPMSQYVKSTVIKGIRQLEKSKTAQAPPVSQRQPKSDLEME